MNEGTSKGYDKILKYIHINLEVKVECTVSISPTQELDVTGIPQVLEDKSLLSQFSKHYLFKISSFLLAKSKKNCIYLNFLRLKRNV